MSGAETSLPESETLSPGEELVVTGQGNTEVGLEPSGQQEAAVDNRALAEALERNEVAARQKAPQLTDSQTSEADEGKYRPSVVDVLFKTEDSPEPKIDLEAIKNILLETKNLKRITSQMESWLANPFISKLLKSNLLQNTAEELVQQMLADPIFVLVLHNELYQEKYGLTGLNDLVRIAFCDSFQLYYSLKNPLTNVWNGQCLEVYFSEQVEKRQLTPILVTLDFNNFKRLNDTWGHVFGDEILKIFARSAQEVFYDEKHRKSDMFAHLGGDEFAALFLVEELNEKNIPVIEKRITDAFQKILMTFRRNINAATATLNDLANNGSPLVDQNFSQRLKFSVGVYGESRKQEQDIAYFFLNLRRLSDTELYLAKERKQQEELPINIALVIVRELSQDSTNI